MRVINGFCTTPFEKIKNIFDNFYFLQFFVEFVVVIFGLIISIREIRKLRFLIWVQEI